MKTELISEQGYKRFYEEFQNLYKKEKPYWVKEKEIAAAFGDRSENAEYLGAKEMLRNIDKRLRFLDKIINYSDVILTDKISHNKVNFGSKVRLLDLNTNDEILYTILGTYESDPSKNIISNKSPLGMLLLRKSIGDNIELKINFNYFQYEIVRPF